MKKIMFAIGLGLISSLANAACVGPFCFDDTGSSVNGLPFNGNGNAIPQVSSATVATLAANSKGQFLWCTTCLKANNGTGVPCYSTSTVVGGYVLLSTQTTVTACQ